MEDVPLPPAVFFPCAALFDGELREVANFLAEAGVFGDDLMPAAAAAGWVLTFLEVDVEEEALPAFVLDFGVDVVMSSWLR